MTSQGIIFVHYGSGTYIARFRGKTAKCSGGERLAAERVARKVMGEKPHILKKCGNDYAWEVLTED